MMSLLWIIALIIVLWGLLRVCGIRTSFSVLPAFLAGEKVLLGKKWICLGSGLSRPSYRWWFSLPPLLEHSLYVTDRRVLHVFHMVRLLRQEFSQWFEQADAASSDDVITDVTTGKSRLLGPYLDIVSETRVKTWYRSDQARLRLFMRDPDAIGDIVSEAMGQERTKDTTRSGE